MNSIISFVLSMLKQLGDLIKIINGCWERVGEIVALFPAWASVSILMLFTFGIILLILKR